jgi:rSAM/selenodomain-associated transferase 1
MTSHRDATGTECVLVFSKPALPGKVKTRLIGELSAVQAAALHAAFLDDLLGRLERGRFDLRLAWAVDSAEPLPVSSVPALRQSGGDLGHRLFRGLSEVAREFPAVGAIGSDHPDIPLSLVHQAFDKLVGGADVALGPADDGGYYLIALRREALRPEIFQEVPWSSSDVLEVTLDHCRELDLKVALLPTGSDVDTPADLDRLCRRLREKAAIDCPRTRRLLWSWGRL